MNEVVSSPTAQLAASTLRRRPQRPAVVYCGGKTTVDQQVALSLSMHTRSDRLTIKRWAN